MGKLLKSKEFVLSSVVFFCLILSFFVWFLPFLHYESAMASKINPSSLIGYYFVFGQKVTKTILIGHGQTKIDVFDVFNPTILIAFICLVIATILIVVNIVLKLIKKNEYIIIANNIFIIALLLTSSIIAFFIPAIFTMNTNLGVILVGSGYIFEGGVTLVSALLCVFYFFI